MAIFHKNCTSYTAMIYSTYENASFKKKEKIMEKFGRIMDTKCEQLIQQKWLK